MRRATAIALMLAAAAVMAPLYAAMFDCAPHGCCAPLQPSVTAANGCCTPAVACADRSNERAAKSLAETPSRFSRGDIRAIASAPVILTAESHSLEANAAPPPASTRSRLARLSTLLI